MQFQGGDMAVLRSTPLLSGLSAADLEALLRGAAVEHRDRGKILFLQDEAATAFYVVLDGWVKVYRMTPAGEEAVVGVFTRGQSFAEAVCFRDGHYPVSGETATDCRLLVVPSAHLARSIRRSPEIGLAMLASTSQHLHALIVQIEQLKAHTGAQRIAEFLISLAPVPRGACAIALPYDKALIAGRLGMKPESLSRGFQRLASVGVRIKQNIASIADVGALADFVHQERAAVLKSAGPAKPCRENPRWLS